MSSIICCFIIALIAAADQLIKYAVLNSSLVVLADGEIKEGSIITVIDKFLQLDYEPNTGAAFSILEDKTEFLAVFSAVVLLIGFYLIFARKIKSKVLLVSVVMIMGGGLGNLIDRVWHHFVIDYIRVLFIDFPVFNFADCFVTVGEFILIGYLLWDIIRDLKKGKVRKNG